MGTASRFGPRWPAHSPTPACGPNDRRWTARAFARRTPAEYRRRRFALSVAGYFADRRLAHGLTPFLVQSRVAEAIADSLEDSDRTAEVAGALPG